MTPQYKASNGTWRTGSLFWERAMPSDTPVFTLYEKREGYISARDTFVALEDPTGYKWALEYLGDWEHFQKLMKAPWFVDAFNSWNEQLHIKLKSEAISKIKEIGEGSGNNALAAQKYLAEKGWEKAENKRGRPTRAELKGELKRQAAILSDEDVDAERIGLRVVGGTDYNTTRHKSTTGGSR